VRVLCILSVVSLTALLRADDPELLAKDFVNLARTIAGLGTPETYEEYRALQRRAVPLYRDFLNRHPDSVYSNTVRWSLYGAYVSLEWKEQASAVLDEILDSTLQELLRVCHAQRNIGNTKGADQILEGLLAKSEDGGVRARTAQYLYMIGQTDRALKIINEVIEDPKEPDEIRARALLIKADLFRFPTQDVSILKELVKRFPDTKAGKEGKRRLRAALAVPGSDALPFEVKTVDGRLLRSEELRGKVVLLWYFATWSYPSWRDLDKLKKAVEKLPAGSVTVICAACETYRDRPKVFLQEKGISWPLVSEGNKWRNSLALLYDVRTLPYYVLIDRKGKIAFKGSMRVDKLIPFLEQAVLK